jgi:hypothetical protein
MKEQPAAQELLAAIATKDPVSGHTHNFYRYPARFSPIFVREVIRQYSQPGQVVLDPFMGGGTSIVEALALGRKAIGVDLNALAHFVTTVKTTPLSVNDSAVITSWVEEVRKSLQRGVGQVSERVYNLPWHVQQLWADIMVCVEWLPSERQRRFVRCALLKTGQDAIDCKKTVPSSKVMVQRFFQNMEAMLVGIEAFIESCQDNGIRKTQIRRHRSLFCRSTSGIEHEASVRQWHPPQLVVTSPPYPAVHILYHRWQVEGRRETPAPYWLAALRDGHPASHYTFGSRSPLGLENYFRNVQECFTSVRKVLAPNAAVVQLVAFSDAESQLPRYLAAMEVAGFEEQEPPTQSGDRRLWRKVPNRKWYCHNGREQDSAREIVLFHRPA